MLALIENDALSPEARGDMIITYVKDAVKHGRRDQALTLLTSVVQTVNDPALRIAAITGFGFTGGRDAYTHLIAAIDQEDDQDLRLQAIAALGKTQDSRALFALVNLYHSRPKARDMVVHALSFLNDPRAISFLEQLVNDRDELISELAKTALQNAYTPREFYYTFVGSEKNRTWPYDMSAHVHITKPEDLHEVPEEERPASYVVMPDYHFITSTETQVEHVALARSGDVLAAGEFRVQHTPNGQRIREINNRSYGYYPGPTSIDSVKKALRYCKVNIPQSFSDVYPKEGYFTPEFLQQFPFFTHEAPQ